MSPVDRYLTPREVADILGVTPKTLGNWRVLGKGPRWVLLGKLHGPVRYPASAVTAYMATRDSRSSHDVGSAPVQDAPARRRRLKRPRIQGI
ncbi:helix-turn-helix transcriptional regulator [Streptomyces hesseae]|uniref:helix-turn-helix transcriptional regulator n=1 Tax=Streptomyces hesseae TaxID=3075519 RepID=UPI0034D984EE